MTFVSPSGFQSAPQAQARVELADPDADSWLEDYALQEYRKADFLPSGFASGTAHRAAATLPRGLCYDCESWKSCSGCLHSARDLYEERVEYGASLSMNARPEHLPGSEQPSVFTSNPEVMGGRLVFRGTRIPLDVLFENLADGVSLNEILDTYPGLRREDAVTAILMAKEKLKNCA